MTQSAYETNARHKLFFTGFKRNWKSISVKELCHFQYWKNWPGKKHGGVLKFRTRCDVLARQVKAMATWSDRAVYHAVLWWWILDWFTWLVLASRRLKGLYYTQTHERVRSKKNKSQYNLLNFCFFRHTHMLHCTWINTNMSTQGLCY